MPAEDTVATLNQVGGKSAATGSRFKARMSDVWSPQKATQSGSKAPAPNQRSSSRLKPKRLSQAGLSANRRASFSLPTGGDDEDQTPAPKPKKRPTLKKTRNVDGKSPLKKHGYSIKLAENSKVNLADSPSKNTRSKNDNPLAPLIEANLPLPESLTRPDQLRASAGEKSQRKTLDSTDGSAVTPRKRKRDGSSGNSQGKASITGTVDHTDIDDNDERVDREINDRAEDDRPDERAVQDNECNDSRRGQDSEVEQEKESEQSDQSTSLPKNSRGQPRTDGTSKDNKKDDNKGDNRQERDDEEQISREGQRQQPEPIEQSSAVLQQSKQSELALEEEAEILKQQARFAKSIETALQISECEDFWKRAGGAALIITAKAPIEPKSARGRAAKRCVRKLQGLYKELWSNSQGSSQQKKSIASTLEEVDSRCGLLSQTGNKSRDVLTIKDMYQVIIPALMNLMKAFFRGRCRTQFLSESVLRELFRLLEVTINVCVKARAWDPQPITLEYGIKRMVKNDILANLKRIKKKYQSDIDQYNWIEMDRTRIQKLAEKQAMAREAQAQRIALIKMKRQQQRYRSSESDMKQHQVSNPLNTTRKEEIHNIDEIENDISVPPSTDDIAEAPKVTIRSRPPFRRESTADLPPPLSVNLSEQEKMALLNGLQIYTGDDRYNDILNDQELGAVLGKRDLDDLVQAARSFSQMMASKLGAERYQNDSAFSWLRTVDPDMQGRASVEL